MGCPLQRYDSSLPLVCRLTTPFTADCLDKSLRPDAVVGHPGWGDMLPMLILFVLLQR